MRRLVFTLAAAALVSLPAVVSGAGPLRTFVPGNFAIEIDGKHSGYLKSVEGGAIQAEVIEEQRGGAASIFTKKHIGMPKYEDFTMQVGPAMGDGLVNWVEAFFKDPSRRHDGAIVAANFNLEAKTRHEFQDALLTEIGFPALDGASKDPAYLVLKIAPESIDVKPGDGSVLPAVQKQKLWQASNFRFTLGDLPCKRVAKIDSFTVKQTVAQNEVGEDRVPQREPAKIEIPNLKVTISLADVDPWADWAETFIAGGKNSDADEKTGSIEYLDPSLKDVLVRLELQHVGIVGLRRLPPGDPDSIGIFEVELYVEEMHLDIDPK